MFIGHLPAGYCVTTMLAKGMGVGDTLHYRRYLWIGLVASVLPDIDMFYFYWIDLRQTSHHTYWTHLPIFWITGAYCLASIGELFRSKALICATTIALINMITHFVLDSICSKIRWFYPASNVGIGLFDIPAVHHWWVWNYIFHWTFIFELMIVLMAFGMLYYRYCMGHLEPNPEGRSPICR